MATQLEMINAALVLLNKNTIRSLSPIPGQEQPKSAKVMAALWPFAAADVLRAHLWRFNHKTADLSQENVTPSDPNYKYQFLLPASYALILDVMDQYGDRVRDYAISEGRIMRNERPLKVQYQRDLVETEWPGYIANLMTLRLAWGAAEPLNGEGRTKDRFKKDYEDTLKECGWREAVQQQPKPVINKQSGWLRRHQAG